MRQRVCRRDRQWGRAVRDARFWAVIPAAGAGTRMGAEIPKQYRLLAGRPVITHCLERIGSHPRIAGVVVALSPRDRWWEARVQADADGVIRVDGGAERCHSVLNALLALSGTATGDDWVLVHDAARPCVRRADIDRLLEELADHPVGGLLGLPVRDTMKRTDSHGEIRETVSREGLWHALTPQMFRVGPLTNALRQVVERGGLVTDEAQAMELVGMAPRMLEGSADNIKITHPQDLILAELYLKQQAAEACE